MDYGRISKFDADRCFGFIAPDRGGADIFFHVSGLARGSDPRQLRLGTQVSYEEDTSGPKGLKAVRIKVLSTRPEDAWPEYAPPPSQSAAEPLEGDPWAEAWEAAREAFWSVLKARGLFS